MVQTYFENWKFHLNVLCDNDYKRNITLQTCEEYNGKPFYYMSQEFSVNNNNLWIYITANSLKGHNNSDPHFTIFYKKKWNVTGKMHKRNPNVSLFHRDIYHWWTDSVLLYVSYGLSPLGWKVGIQCFSNENECKLKINIIFF